MPRRSTPDLLNLAQSRALHPGANATLPRPFFFSPALRGVKIVSIGLEPTDSPAGAPKPEEALTGNAGGSIPPPGLIPKSGRFVVLGGNAISPSGTASGRIAMLRSVGGDAERDRGGDGASNVMVGASTSIVGVDSASSDSSDSGGVAAFDHPGIDGREGRSCIISLPVVRFSSTHP